MFRAGICVIILMFFGVAYASPLDDSISVVRDACRGISDELTDMKRMAGINTAVTSVGTVAGGVALGTGIAKAGVDKKASEIEQELQEEINRLHELAAKQNPGELTAINIDFGYLVATAGGTSGTSVSKPGADRVAELQSDLDALNAKSKNLGNWRTGTLAVNTATNIAGAAIAGNNRIKGDLQTRIDACVAGVNNLKLQLGQARVSGDASDVEINRAQQIVTECGMWSTVNLSSINKRATGAAVSSGIGAGVGLIGTITSASANSQKVRDGDDAKEKNLNTAANVMAGGATAASATATIFNATQISAIKRAAEVADKCEGALNQ